MTDPTPNDDEHATVGDEDVKIDDGNTNYLRADEPPTDPGRRTLTARESRVKQWFLLDGNRMHVSAVVLVGVFVALVVATFVWPFEMQRLVDERSAVQGLFNTLLSGTILLVSVVVSINSVVLSQDLTSIGTQQQRVENAMQFRNSVEELAGVDSSPTDPAEFLQAMVELLVENVEALDEALQHHEDEALQREARTFLSNVRTHAGDISHRIDSEGQRSIDVLLAGLSYDYASDTETARWLSSRFEDSLSEEERAALDRVAETLEQFAISHGYFKSLIYMREFAKLSKALLYVSIPVIVFTSYVMLAISSGEYPIFDLWHLSSLTVLLIFAYTVALAPYVVLSAFVLRSASIASRSLATGPFVMDAG